MKFRPQLQNSQGGKARTLAQKVTHTHIRESLAT